ncbi:signal peptidase I [Cellulomonas sp. NPDC055163]
MTTAAPPAASVDAGVPVPFVTVVARVVVLFLVGLLAWSLAPAAIGWQPRPVLTGSMSPAVDPGDVVVTAPVEAGTLAPGLIIAFRDAARPGNVLLHRVVRVEPDGSIITRGDANPQDDSTPVHPDDVLGEARLSVPHLALPLVWVHEGDMATGGLALLLVLSVAVLAVGLPATTAGRVHAGAAPTDGPVRPDGSAPPRALTVPRGPGEPPTRRALRVEHRAEDARTGRRSGGVDVALGLVRAAAPGRRTRAAAAHRRVTRGGRPARRGHAHP